MTDVIDEMLGKVVRHLRFRRLEPVEPPWMSPQEWSLELNGEMGPIAFRGTLDTVVKEAHLKLRQLDDIMTRDYRVRP